MSGPKNDYSILIIPGSNLNMGPTPGFFWMFNSRYIPELLDRLRIKKDRSNFFRGYRRYYYIGSSSASMLRVGSPEYRTRWTESTLFGAPTPVPCIEYNDEFFTRRTIRLK